MDMDKLVAVTFRRREWFKVLHALTVARNEVGDVLILVTLEGEQIEKGQFVSTDSDDLGAVMDHIVRQLGRGDD